MDSISLGTLVRAPLCLVLLFQVGLVLWYRWVVAEKLVGQIRTSVGSGGAVRYLELFVPQREPGDGDEVGRVEDRLRAILLRESFWGAALILLLVTAGALLACDAWLRHWLEKPEAALFPEVVLLAIAGGLVWSLFDILDHVRLRHLSTIDLMQAAFGLLAALPIGYAFSLIALEGFGPFVAFGVAAFPLNSIRRMIRVQTLRRLDANAALTGSTAERDKLEVLGLGAESIAALEEIQLTAPRDLAYADPVAVMAATGRFFDEVIDWKDQALLSLYLDLARRRPAEVGIRTAIDAMNLYVEKCLGPDEQQKADAAQDPLIVQFAARLEITPEQCVWILDQIYHDPHAQLLDQIWND